MLCSGFQQRTFPFLWVPELSPASATNCNHQLVKTYFTTGGSPPISSSLRRAAWDSRPEFFFQLNTCGHSPYVTYNCCWSSPAHSFSGPSPTRLMTFYCLRFETPSTWGPGTRIYIPQEQGGRYTPWHWVPFPSPFTTRGATVEVIRTLLHIVEASLLCLHT
jgi:hypothetical protein